MRLSFAFLLLALLAFAPAAPAQDYGADAPSLAYYYPTVPAFDEAVPSPEAFFGFQVGEWHLSHDQVVYYFKALAESSARVTLTEYARSHEQRPLLLLTITSAGNQGRIDEMRTEHLKLTDPRESDGVNIDELPAVLWMGYGVHGNEPSAMNAAVLMAYYLAAAQGPQVEAMLNELVIILDPALNPDGNQRFAGWVNSHKGARPTADNTDREHNEVWPGGRTNHYWFDLNRDWLPLTHPESQGRIAQFHRWKPNVLLDYHEMGGNATYFFQPGIKTRTHPLTPERTIELTTQLARYHAKALDAIGSQYYSGESFDDFYYGKGSTYPDVNGAIGILFEQASARGHIAETQNGLLTFPFAIRNHVRTSFSSIEGTRALRKELLAHQRTFYKEAMSEGRSAGFAAWALQAPNDPQRLAALARIFSTHQVEVYKSDKDFSAGGTNFKAQTTLLVPTAQQQYRLAKALLEIRTEFEDSLFYDVSAWTLPLAFNLETAQVPAGTYSSLQRDLRPVMGDADWDHGIMGGASGYGYFVQWSYYKAPALLHALQENGIRVRLLNAPVVTPGGQRYEAGTLFIPVQRQHMNANDLWSTIEELAQQVQVPVIPVSSGDMAGTHLLGSPTIETIAPVKIALVVGGSGGYVSGYEAGEVWYTLEERFNIPVTLVEAGELASLDWSTYTHLIMVSGGYNAMPERLVERVRAWVSEGGTLIGSGSAVAWLRAKDFLSFEATRAASPDYSMVDYDDASTVGGAQFVGGAIVGVEYDNTHPLFYGYDGRPLPVFRRGSLYIQPAADRPFSQPATYLRNDAFLSGYASSQNRAAIGGMAAIQTGRVGGGVVIGLVDNLNFRGFYYGTTKVFMNAIFFGPTISRF